MKFFQEFKEFAMRGNVIDLAVGLVVGAAFGKITTSLVNDIIMPPLGLILGQVDFSGLYWNLSRESFDSLAAAESAGALTVNYGAFLTTVIDFLIIAFVIFVFIKQINKLKRQDAVPPPAPRPSAEALLLTEIRDLLKSGKK